MSDPTTPANVVDRILAGAPGPVDDPTDTEPDPPVYSDAESDRAADQWETDRDRTASQ